MNEVEEMFHDYASIIRRRSGFHKRHLHNYKREFGGSQEELIVLYLDQGKSYDEIQSLLKCPRPSIRRINSYSPEKKKNIRTRMLIKRKGQTKLQ